MQLKEVLKTARKISSPYRVDRGKGFALKHFDPDDTGGLKSEDKPRAKDALATGISALADLQDKLYAQDRWAMLLIFQAMDAAGKDGAIKHVMSGVNPQGVNVHSFKAPNSEELLHHYLWRPSRVLPARGEIAIFNRSYYEEVLVVRVHPKFLDAQWVPAELRKDHKRLWKSRYEEINEFEAIRKRANNTTVLKFFLNVSKQEQRKRFLERLDNPEKNWKFSHDDLREREFWDDYQQAYEDMLNATSTDESPWFVIPADKKWFTRACVADIVARSIEKLGLKYPTVPESERAALAEAKQKLEAERDE